MTNSYTTGPNLFRKFLLAGVTLALSVLFSVSSWGQAATYNYSASSGTYTEITGGTVVSTAAWDDNVSTLQTIPSFVYNGTTVTTMSISSNGWLAIGGTAASSSTTTYTALSSSVSATGAAGVISPFGRDLIGGASAEVRWQTIGSETIIQWKGLSIYLAAGSNVNFQVRLNHTTNTISMVYGIMAQGTNTTSPQVGIKSVVAAGTIATTMLNLTLKNIPIGTSCLTWANAVRGRLTTETMLFSNTAPVATVASGTTFTFTPQSGLAATWVNPVTTFTANTTWSINTSGATPSWTAPTNANRYNVQFRRAADCSWTNFSGNPVSAVSAALTGLQDATTYHVRVQPFNNSTSNTAGYSHITAGTVTANSDGYVAAGSFTTLAFPATVTGYTVAGVASNPICDNGGQTVVLTGTSFTSGSSVSFGGTLGVGALVNSPTQITVIAPALASIGTGFITVTNSSGTASATGAANAFTKQARPMVAFSPSASVVPCGSYPLTVTASNSASVTPTTWAWSNASTLSAAAGNAVEVLTTTTQSYVATATDAYGCTNTGTLTATPSAPTAITATPSVPYFCGTGGPVTVVAASANTNYAYTFSVQEGAGTISGSGPDTRTFTVPTTSVMRVRAVDAVGGCATDSYVSVGVYPFPSSTMTATPSTLCAGSTSVIGSGLSAGNFSSAAITHAPLTAPGSATTLVNAGVATVAQTTVSLDDGGWSSIPMGFSFNFFGTNYTTCNVGTNGTIMFGTYNGTSTGLGDFTFTTLPSLTEPFGMVAVLAMDNDLSGATGGAIKYWTEGFAPNRRFIVAYLAAKEYGDTKFSTAQAIFYETTGIVEVHVTSSTNLDRQKVVGINGPAGNIGVLAFASGTVAATNNPIVTSFAYRFSPPSNYTTTWSPAGNFAAPTTGTNLFSKTTNALSTVGVNTISLVVTDQTTGCTNSASPASIAVTVLAIPSVPATAYVTGFGSVLGSTSAAQSPLTVCGPQTVTINYGGTLSSAGPEVVRWYSAATGGTLLVTGTSYTTPSLTASDTVYVEIYNGICASTSRFPYIITYNTPPTVIISSLGPDNDVNCGHTAYSMSYSVASSNDPNYAYTWSTDGNADSFSTTGGSATLGSDSTTVSHLIAFDATSGCLIEYDKPFSVFDFPLIVPTSLDSIMCIGDSITVSSGVEVGNFSATCIISQYNWRTPPTSGGTRLVLNGVTDVALTSGSLDDGGWGGIPVGFTFDFFGVDYTSLNVGTNGVVQFGTYNGTALSDYIFNGLPSLTEPLGVIAVVATDLYLTTTGRVRYWTEGVAPNRVFVLEYNNCPGWITDGSYSAQLHLFETTGVFQIHVFKATGAGNKTIGVNSPNGTIGATAPICNPAPGGATSWNSIPNTVQTNYSQAWQFNPPVDYTFAWTPSAQISGATNAASIVARPTATVAGSQDYTIAVTDNVSGCVGTPVTYPVQIIEVPALPNIVGWGSFSDVDGTNGTTFCGEQSISWYCSDPLAAGWQVNYRLTPTGTAYPFDAADTITVTNGGVPVLFTANDTIWASLSNGHCEGAFREIVFTYQTPDTIAISNSSPINCGPSTATYTSDLVASSTAPYVYTWNASPYLNTTSGDSVTASINRTTVFTVNGTDGFCYNSKSVAVSRYNFPDLVPSANNDSICPGGSTVLQSNTSNSGFTIISKGYSPQSSTGATINYLCFNGTEIVPTSTGGGFTDLDDGGWYNVPLGFDFDYLGTTYSTVNVSTNGNIQFGSSATFSSGFVSVTIPAPSTPNNFIALFWGDLDFSNTSGQSQIYYYVSGIAPNRAFNIRYDGYRYGQASSRFTGTISLNEATGVIDLDIQEVTHTGTSSQTMGAENSTGTVGGSPTGRATGTWQISTPEGWKLVPPTNYSYEWLPALEVDGSNTLATAAVSPSVTTEYQLIVVDNATTCTNEFVNQEYLTVTIASAAPVANFTANDLTATTGGVLQVVTLTPTTVELGGETYLWNFSPNTITYVNGTSALSRVPQVQFNAPGQYTVSMQVTSCTGTAAITKNGYISVTAQYCYPAFGGTFGGGCDFGDEIGDVRIYNPASSLIMAHLSTGCTTGANAYEAYAPVAGTTSCTFYQGSTYSLQVSSSYFSDYFAAWLDVNNDGDFNDPLEFLGSSSTAGSSATFSLGIPSSNVVYGAHKLRVICADSGTPLTQANACMSLTYGETHDYTVFVQPPVILNDIPTFAVSVQNSTNLTYPTCYAFNGNTSLATNSPETPGIAGGDVWYKFTAQSTAVAIKVSSTTMDDIIALYSRDGSGNYILIDSENASSGNGDYEQLNVSGLTAGTQYWIAIGSNTGGGAFSLCIQNLMRSGCGTSVPVGGLRLCDLYRGTYRGAASQGVSYTFQFTPTGATTGSATSVTGTNLTVLSAPALALHYGGTYDVKVNVLYTLTNSAGATEAITVLGNTADANCTGVAIQNHPLMEVRSNQRCPAALLRSAYLAGVTAPGSTSTYVCAATNFTYEFTPASSCAGAVNGIAVLHTTTGSQPYMPLGVLGSLPNPGAWNVRVRPNFSYGPGDFGASYTILVNGTAASTTLEESAVAATEKVESFIAANLYPNPNTGEMVNLNVSGIESDNVFVRITDAMGRVVYTNRFTVEGSLNTIVTFAEPLASGMYNVEFTVDGEIMTERMIVAKQ